MQKSSKSKLNFPLWPSLLKLVSQSKMTKAVCDYDTDDDDDVVVMMGV